MLNNLILLVEDNIDDETMTIRELQKGKIKSEILVIRDGQEALEYLFCEGTYEKRPKVCPQLVILDLNLPKIGGMEILQTMRANIMTKLLPVIILTSSREEKDLITTYSSGAISYMVKPVEMDQFLQAIYHLKLYSIFLN